MTVWGILLVVGIIALGLGVTALWLTVRFYERASVGEVRGELARLRQARTLEARRHQSQGFRIGAVAPVAANADEAAIAPCLDFNESPRCEPFPSVNDPETNADPGTADLPESTTCAVLPHDGNRRGSDCGTKADRLPSMGEISSERPDEGSLQRPCGIAVDPQTVAVGVLPATRWDEAAACSIEETAALFVLQPINSQRVGR